MGKQHFGYFTPGQNSSSYTAAHEEMHRQLAHRLALPPGSRVLDAGCGEGHTALYLAKQKGFQVEGIDLVDTSLEAALKAAQDNNLTEKVHVQVGDYATYPWPKESFDAVFTMETLVHVANYQDALAHFYELLKPKGVLVLFEYSMTAPKNLKLTQLRLWEQVIEQTSMYGLPHFHHGAFPEILGEAGFDSVVVEDITEHTLPMLEQFYHAAKLRYKLISILGLQKRFPTITFAVEGYEDIITNSTWRYNIITARKK